MPALLPDQNSQRLATTIQHHKAALAGWVPMDNLPAHKAESILQAIEQAGAELHYLPPYSPDFNPIEMAFSKLKAILRGKAERTVSALWDAVGDAIPLFTTDECAHSFAAAGYDPD